MLNKVIVSEVNRRVNIGDTFNVKPGKYFVTNALVSNERVPSILAYIIEHEHKIVIAYSI